ncbi:MAG: multidrug DMT transporter permease [Rhodobacterales bacterium RIFCSPHIGHO2_02_FULL_62_130]|nr:MAG: multidrug DMT transporter permease [Rhodobacterales bacterium RIFCSPHIGHO2_12_FULL_62_75]OHC59771.1 MAG: multidrug DMT transporter permease [Rhodobacterales bacterium RIFCSPHIGHO2_02_FULL_62_130]
MASFWILAALIAAAAQTARNATQASLTRAIGTVGATQVRFLFGLPFACLFLALVTQFTGESIPALTPRALGFTTLGAVAQIGATALMLVTMKSRGFGVTSAWLKTEPVMVALIAAVVLGDPLTLPALAAIALATGGVLLMSVKPGTGLAMWREAGPALTGILAGALFGASAIGFRGGITSLETGDFLIRATTTLVLSLGLQTAILMVWLLLFDRTALRASFGVWLSSLGAGFLGAFASQFWFIGFSLTSAANIRTLALVEVIFAAAVSRYVFRQAITTRQIIGMAVICAGVGWLLRLHG